MPSLRSLQPDQQRARNRAVKARQRIAKGRGTDVDRAYLAKYAKEHPHSLEARASSARPNAADSMSPQARATPPRDGHAHHTELLPAGVSPDDFTAIPTSPPPPAPDAPEPAADAAPPPATPFVAMPDPGDAPPTAEQQAQIEAGANRAGAILAGIAEIGRDAMATFCELKGHAKRAEWLRNEKVQHAVAMQTFTSGRNLALKYGVAVVLPYEDELIAGGVVLATVSALLAVHELEKKNKKEAPAMRHAHAAPVANENEGPIAPIFEILRGGGNQ